jgi:hypothetical protein
MQTSVIWMMLEEKRSQVVGVGFDTVGEVVVVVVVDEEM